MQCRSCGMEIADKAIVCYRCGTATAETAPAPRRRRSSSWSLAALFVVVVASVWAIPRTPAHSVGRVGAWTGLIVAASVIVVWISQRARR